MTCIVGVARGGRVWIGGDSASVSGYDIAARVDAKVFKLGPYVLGFTDSFRMGQLLRYCLELPAPPARDLERFMCTTFIDAVRDCLKEGGFATSRSDQEAGGTFLAGAQGRLFEVYSDYQVGETRNGFSAIGCGAAYALGVLDLTGRQQMEPRSRARLALETAARHSAGVCGPFKIVNGGFRV